MTCHMDMDMEHAILSTLLLYYIYIKSILDRYRQGGVLGGWRCCQTSQGLKQLLLIKINKS
jgi:hypothetical protein